MPRSAASPHRCGAGPGAPGTFTLIDGVEPTNNHAERGLRGRRHLPQSQSDRGERTIERLLSASITCRLRRRSLFAYLSDVPCANIRGDPIPS
jgi:hypothetical protein